MPSKYERIAAFTHSKHRDMFGLVGIELREGNAYVRLAREWTRDDINHIPARMASIYAKVMWDYLYMDVLAGDHLIKEMHHIHGMRVRLITTEKNVKDTDKIDRTRALDWIEMVQWFLSLTKQGKVRFPKTTEPGMRELNAEMNLFAEHKTEAGGMNYFAPGEEHDHFPRCLLIACFGARGRLQGRSYTRQVASVGNPQAHDPIGSALGGTQEPRGRRQVTYPGLRGDRSPGMSLSRYRIR